MKMYSNGGQRRIDSFFKRRGTETSEELEETVDRNISEYDEPDTSDKREVDESPARKRPRLGAV